MAVKTDPPADDEPDVKPLSFFFPEITEDEARTLDHETFAIAERRTRVIGMYRDRMTMTRIATECRCSLATVCRDVHAVLEGYKRLSARAADAKLADLLQQLQRREEQLEAAWFRSMGEPLPAFAPKRAGRGKAAAADADGPPRRPRDGKAEYASLLLRVLETRAKLWGLLSEDAKSSLAGAGQLQLVEEIVVRRAEPAAAG